MKWVLKFWSQFLEIRQLLMMSKGLIKIEPKNSNYANGISEWLWSRRVGRTLVLLIRKCNMLHCPYRARRLKTKKSAQAKRPSRLNYNSSLLFLKAAPDPVFKYLSKSQAFFLSGKRERWIRSTGNLSLVKWTSPFWCADNRLFIFSVYPV